MGVGELSELAPGLRQVTHSWPRWHWLTPARDGDLLQVHGPLRGWTGAGQREGLRPPGGRHVTFICLQLRACPTQGRTQGRQALPPPADFQFPKVATCVPRG